MAASLLSPLSYPVCTCSAGATQENGRKRYKTIKSSIKVNELPSANPPATKVEGGRTQSAHSAFPAFTSTASAVDDLKVERSRQNIPTKKQTADPFRLGLLAEGGPAYQQTFVIRSYEVGPDRTATLETILSLLQETGTNHIWMSGLLSDGFGATHGMMRNNLIWVVTRLHVQVDNYPIWGDVVDIETWGQPSGKNGMQRDWVIRRHLTDQVFARGTSTWVMMNHQTRRLSKIPEEVRDELSPWFVERQSSIKDVPEKIIKLGNDAKYANSNLKPKRSDLDMNHHVNNVKYVQWMLEAIPDQFLENHELSSIILEYRRECSSSDMIQSLCESDGGSISEDDDIDLPSGFSVQSESLDGRGISGNLDKWPIRYTHLLRTIGENKKEEILRGRTTWTKKSFTTSSTASH